MKALVVGLGSIGTRHLNNLQILGVDELSAFRSRELKPPGEIPSHTRFFNNYDEALSDRPNIVVIANPTSFHLSFAQKALDANCHLYLEKPVSHTLDGVETLLKTAEERKLIVAVGCQFRFHPNLEQIKVWLEQGLIGGVLSVFADMGEYLPDWHPWEDYRKSYSARDEMGGGVILTLIHELDNLFWIFGAMKSVYALGGHLTPLEVDVEDTALISLLTKTDIAIQLRMDYWRKPPVRTMNIVGDKGEIFWDYYKGEVVLFNRESKQQIEKIPENWDRNDLFLATMRDFLDALKNKTAPRTPIRDGVDVLKIALSVKKSIKQKNVIEL
jgi:predicted dehydrogenase